ncbi:MAG: hypothetical protein ABR548_06195 [Actinomycetota bacterium]|nr:hypothetical protein [Actinomycetota bacterium]
MGVLPERKATRRIIILVVVLAIAASLWVWVFPWIDRTYVNQPAIEQTGALTQV